MAGGGNTIAQLLFSYSTHIIKEINWVTNLNRVSPGSWLFNLRSNRLRGSSHPLQRLAVVLAESGIYEKSLLVAAHVGDHQIDKG